MKKYVKPDLYFESFQLTQHIAACAYDMINSNDPDNCYSYGDKHNVYTNYGESMRFFSNENVCTDGKPEIYCYFNGAIQDDMFKVLNS